MHFGLGGGGGGGGGGGSLPCDSAVPELGVWQKQTKHIF